jgi:hypothetical protein
MQLISNLMIDFTLSLFVPEIIYNRLVLIEEEIFFDFNIKNKIICSVLVMINLLSVSRLIATDTDESQIL